MPLAVFNNIYGFQIESQNYYNINETNPFINNYLVKNSMIETTRIFKLSFMNRFLPLELNISSKSLTQIFKLCVDFITDDDLYFINKIFEGKDSSLSALNKDLVLLHVRSGKKEKSNDSIFDEQIVIYNDKQRNVYSFESKKKTEEMFFSKVDVILKLNEIHEYVLKREFVNNINTKNLPIFFEFVKTLRPFSKFNAKIVFIYLKDQPIKMTLPEYFILGIWSFLKENDEEPHGGNLNSLFECRL
jgi:hypothetical protein